MPYYCRRKHVNCVSRGGMIVWTRSALRFFYKQLVRIFVFIWAVCCRLSLSLPLLNTPQVPPEEKIEFQEFLQELGYTYHDESRNPVYRQFFKSDD